ncbi:MAG: hypothetical protein PHH98_00085 [Candidatus Gracilibacteria bacterium]|nr:hypothetical protein [Candidatus Gracilibacteria bacterium]
MVHDARGNYVQLKVGFGNKIYLNHNETGYKVGGDGKIYTTSGLFVSKDTVEEFCKSKGLIKGFFDYEKPRPSGEVLFFLKIFYGLFFIMG